MNPYPLSLRDIKNKSKTFEQRRNMNLSKREKNDDSQMDDMIKEKLSLKQKIDSLKQNLSNQIKEKESLLQTFTVIKKRIQSKERMFKIDLDPLAPRLLKNREAHIEYLKHTQEQTDILQGIELLVYVRDTCPNVYIPSEKLIAVTPMNKVKKVRFSEPLTSASNIQQVVQFSTRLSGLWMLLKYDRNRSQTHQLRSRDTNLYTISLDDMLKTSLICLLSKALKTKSWLWHHRLSHLNFSTLNKLAKYGLARGIPMLKFQKDHMCSACALGKSKKSSHQPKAEDTNQEKLYLLHMDLCSPMRV
ncbi:retrovirus-related pol polyprotein from transposon TNT 1-94 [Tanacetum coccineum]